MSFKKFQLIYFSLYNKRLLQVFCFCICPLPSKCEKIASKNYVFPNTQTFFFLQPKQIFYQHRASLF